MTREEFIEVLDNEGYPYKIEGDKLVIYHEDDVYLESLEALPPGLEFRNEGNVNLDSLKTLPPGVMFRNEGFVDLELIESIPSDTEFMNEDDVHLETLIGGWIKDWSGNIKGVSSNRLLNHMISKGMFI